jgi:hypothetical protein
LTELYNKARSLTALEPHYSRHVSAMTSEGLHSKSDIAAELAFRDKELTALRLTLAALSEHDPSWPDDFLRARAALIGVDATLAGSTVSGPQKTGSAP